MCYLPNLSSKNLNTTNIRDCFVHLTPIFNNAESVLHTIPQSLKSNLLHITDIFHPSEHARNSEESLKLSLYSHWQIINSFLHTFSRGIMILISGNRHSVGGEDEGSTFQY